MVYSDTKTQPKVARVNYLTERGRSHLERFRCDREGSIECIDTLLQDLVQTLAEFGTLLFEAKDARCTLVEVVENSPEKQKLSVAVVGGFPQPRLDQVFPTKTARRLVRDVYYGEADRDREQDIISKALIRVDPSRAFFSATPGVIASPSPDSMTLSESQNDLKLIHSFGAPGLHPEDLHEVLPGCIVGLNIDYYGKAPSLGYAEVSDVLAKTQTLQGLLDGCYRISRTKAERKKHSSSESLTDFVRRIAGQGWFRKLVERSMILGVAGGITATHAT